MIIGFSGTREGMSEKQKTIFKNLLLNLEAKNLHHGDCIGADAEAHEIAKILNLKIYIHPPKNNRLRAYCNGNFIFAQKDYLDRNKDIAACSNILIATPKEDNPTRGSGTWATIRYARELNKKIYIILKNGTLLMKGDKNEIGKRNATIAKYTSSSM